MRITLTCLLIVFATFARAQTMLPGGFQSDLNRNVVTPLSNKSDSMSRKEWFISSYGGITTGYTFFRGGSAWVFATPFTFQLNRRLSNNVYAFAGITAAPSFVNFNRAFLTTDPSKVNSGSIFYRPGNPSIYSAATLGLMYVNDAHTFSVSGSVSVERTSFPSYFNNQFNSTKPSNSVLFSR